LLLNILVLATNSLNIVIFAFLTITLHKRLKIEKNLAIKILYYLSIFGIVLGIVQFIVDFPLSNNSDTSVHSLLILGFFRILFAFALVAFLEYYEKDRLSLFTFGVFMWFLGGNFFSILHYIYSIQFEVQIDISRRYYSLFFSSVSPPMIYTVLRSMYIIRSVLKESFNDVQKLQLKLILIGLIFWFFIANIPIAYLFNFVEINQVNILLFVHVFSKGGIIIGVLIISYAFRIADQPIMPGLRHIRSVLIINKEGIPLFTYHFDEEEQSDLDLLLSGGLTAISSVFSETLKEKSLIEAIKFANLHLTLKNSDGLVFIFITLKTVQYLQNVLERFSEEFITKYAEEINSFKGDVSRFNETLDILYQAFGILSVNYKE
jgi:hypothetical protein